MRGLPAAVGTVNVTGPILTSSALTQPSHSEIELYVGWTKAAVVSAMIRKGWFLAVTLNTTVRGRMGG